MIKSYKSVIDTELFRKGPIMLFIWKNSENWPVEAVSQNIQKILGYQEQDFINGNTLYKAIIHPEDFEKAQSEVLFAMEQTEDYFEHTPYRIKTKKGDYIWIADYTFLVRDNEKITHLIGYIYDITNVKNLQLKLQESNDRWMFAIDGNGDGLWDWDVETSHVYFSPQWKNILGYEVHEIEDNLDEWSKRVHPEDLIFAEEAVKKYFLGKTDMYESTHRVMHKDGSYRWILDRGVAIKRDRNNRPLRIIGTHRDITKEKKLEKQMLDYISIVNENVITSSTDTDGIITSVSNAFCRISQYSKEELIGSNHNIIRHPDTPCEVFKELWKCIQDGKIWKGELKNLAKDGTEYWVDSTISPIYNEDDILVGYTAIRQNITDRKKVEKLSITDALTGIYNRLKLDSVLSYELSQSKRYKSDLSVIILDIDNFKSVNDNYGHQTGDSVLKEVSNIVKENSRTSDTIGRWGGEEFLIILPKTSLKEACKVAEKLRNIIELYDFTTVGYKTCSFGVSSVEEETQSEQKLIEKADKALYRAKEKGKNRVES